ncbi:F-box protein At5g07610-like [Chenopodium quinoa]|uniref:F-box protein n=1 Tax=Chenopodium quinoa TaxID=63459 RepID=A0A803KVV8_CHEQI|nr:F-box protein At5g07610-like [Chenopodium quinoa]
MNRVMKKPCGDVSKFQRIYMDLGEILREHALRYLPAKSLQRFRAVCRDWNLLISSPFFIHNQSIALSSMSGFFLQSPGKPPFFISPDRMAHGVPDQELKFLPEAVDVKASSNGLLCCQGRSGDKPYYVCNPVNKQWKKLPKPTANHGSDPTIAFEFEPSLLNFLPDYKVVCIFASTDIEEAYEFEIYSSLQDSWKVASEMFFSSRKLTFLKGITVNGVAYWPTTCGKLLIFDLKKEKATETSAYGAFVNRPPYGNTSLGMMDGKLCRASSTGFSIKVNVLRNIHSNTMPMKFKAGGPWMMKHEVQLKSSDMGLGKNNQLRVLFVWDGMLVLEADGKKVFIHDMRTLTTTLCNESPSNSRYEVFPYINSLVSPV